jgi:hypothetical protein
MLHMSRYTFTRALYAAVIPAANGGAQDVNPTVQAGVGPSRTLCYLLSGGTSVKVEWDPKKARGTAERRDPLRAPDAGRTHLVVLGSKATLNALALQDSEPVS